MKTKKITSIKHVGNGEVYDITVDKNKNYTLENGVITHNSGLAYSASTIIELAKSKEKDGTEVIGNIIRARTMKSRLSKENQEVEIRLFYDERGLDKYYGLLQLAEEGGIIKRVGNRFEIQGKLLYEKAILKDPETYFTPELLQKIDTYAKVKFSYGYSKDSYNEEAEEELVEQH